MLELSVSVSCWRQSGENDTAAETFGHPPWKNISYQISGVFLICLTHVACLPQIKSPRCVYDGCRRRICLGGYGIVVVLVTECAANQSPLMKLLLTGWCAVVSPDCCSQIHTWSAGDRGRTLRCSCHCFCLVRLFTLSATLTLLFQGTITQFHLMLNTKGQRSHSCKEKMRESSPCRLARGT